MKESKRYLTLFTSSFYLSAFTFGGGYIIVPLLKNKFVDNLGWIDENEMMDIVAIAQSSPGSLAVNATILIGYKIGGGMGAFVSTVGTVLPPLILLSIISFFYEAFKSNKIINAALLTMSAGVAAVVLDVVIDMGKSVLDTKSYEYLLIMILAFVASFVFKINILFIIVSVIVYAVVKTFIGGKL